MNQFTHPRLVDFGIGPIQTLEMLTYRYQYT